MISEPAANDDLNFAVLKYPLLGCIKACKDPDLIKKCTKHRNGKNISVRDWAALMLRADQKRNQRATLVGCLSVCKDALQRSKQTRINMFEGVYTTERKQYVVSNVRDLISARKIKLKPKQNSI